MKVIRKMKSDVAITIVPSTMVKGYSYPNIHKTFSFVILFAQFFGIMPLHGITQKNIQQVKFKWKSLRFFYAIYNIIGSLIIGIFCIAKFAVDGLMLDRTGTMCFYILNFFAGLQLIQISSNWSSTLQQWSSVEISMRSYGLVVNLKNRFKIMTAIVMLLALVEHLLFILNSLAASKYCEHFSTYSDEIYFGIAFPSVFTLIKYSPWKAILVEVANLLSTIMWNFTDLFIILISYALVVRFQQIVKRLRTNKTMHEKFWREIREDYNKLANLSRSVDEQLAPLVLISFVNNTFFICVQLYNSLKERVGIIATIYFFYSFGFLLTRTVTVALYGAWINDESRKPLIVLNSVPSQHYCSEISRFIQEINSNPIGITGLKFFIVTRSFMLKMASTIVTFELMFLQFGPLISTGQQTMSNVTYDCIK